jgi:hypothetical protein
MVTLRLKQVGVTPLILMILFAFTFTPAHATSSDQPVVITTTSTDSSGVQNTETKTLSTNQSSGVEYFGTASVSISLTSSVSTSILPTPPPSALLDAITAIAEMVIAGLILWAITQYLEDMLAKRGAKPRPPPPGIVVGTPLLRNHVDLKCSFFVKNSNTSTTYPDPSP